MKQIQSFMHEISDEFKIVVVEAIRSLCIKFPQKYPMLMTFLSSALRDSVRHAEAPKALFLFRGQRRLQRLFSPANYPFDIFPISLFTG